MKEVNQTVKVKKKVYKSGKKWKWKMLQKWHKWEKWKKMKKNVKKLKSEKKNEKGNKKWKS